MVEFKDIYFKVDSRIVEQGFWQVDIAEKKALIDKELKRYAIEKLKEINVDLYLLCKGNANLTINDVVGMLAGSINKENHSDTLSHFIHYIIIVSGSLQNHSIVWWVEEAEEFIKQPFIEFNEVGYWENLITHKETDFVQIFNFVYEIFNNYFLVDKVYKRARIKSDELNKDK